MATPKEKLAESLEILQELQNAQGAAAIRSKDLSRTHRERLVTNRFLQEVMKGWFIPTRPDEKPSDSTSWYASFWRFCEAYLTYRFKNNWCLSPEQSLMIHSDNYTIPQQLLVRSTRGTNNTIPLPHNTSLFDLKALLPQPADRAEKNGLKLYVLPAALIESSPLVYQNHPTDMRTALTQVRNASEILPKLLDKGQSVVAGRMAGAFRNIGRDDLADEIMTTMKAAAYDVREVDPFAARIIYRTTRRPTSPYVTRLQVMWGTMREVIIRHFPKAPGIPRNNRKFLKHVEEVSREDAYHSLSIEGYKVTPELIERVRSGTWNPDGDDKQHRDAMAARGYYLAQQAVVHSLEKILQGENAGKVADDNLGIWYRELFAPSVLAGLLKSSDLAGYRNGPVYIRGSKHVPLNRDAVLDAMPALFDLLTNEPEPSVRVVLGHFIFVFIHPYMDGNGRIGRFLMNAMLASGGYPWTIVPVEKRKEYMAALEQASVHQNILPFTKFLGGLVEESMEGARASIS